MELLCGGERSKAVTVILVRELIFVCRISKTMGESFKLHSQALVGYEDEIITENAPGMASMPGSGPMTVETAY